MPSATDPSKREFAIILFFWGDPVLAAAAFCRNSRPETVGVITYEPVPRMELEAPANTEGVNSDVAAISFDMTRISHLSAGAQAFLTKMYGQDPVHRTYASMANVQVSETGVQTVSFLHKGEVRKRETNSSPGVLSLEVSNPKNVEESTSGFSIDIVCSNVFGDERCGINLSTIQEPGTISYISGFKSEITGLALAPHPDYWKKGYVFRNGLYIPIMDWSDADPEVFTLARKSPADWEGLTVQVVPGCLLDVPACERWNNVQRMNALGLSTASKHPIFETS